MRYVQLPESPRISKIGLERGSSGPASGDTAMRPHSVMRGMAALQDVGMVGEVGVSDYALDRWQRAESALGRRVLSNQVQYNLVRRDPERDLVPYAEAHERIVIARWRRGC